VSQLVALCIVLSEVYNHNTAINNYSRHHVYYVTLCRHLCSLCGIRERTQENIAGVRDVELALLQCGVGVWGPGPSVVGVGRFYGRLVLERMSKIAFGKMVWSLFIWLLLDGSVNNLMMARLQGRNM
jgi:hypothetical protein